MTLSLNLYFALAGLALLLVSFAAYRGTTPALPRKTRVLLTVFRAAAFAAIVFLLMDPRYVVRSERSEAASVIALIDRSESMSLPAGAPGSGPAASRFDAARASARRVKNAVEERGALYEEMFFTGAGLSAASDTLRANGQGTDLRGALEQAYKRYEGRNIAGFVVFSDGVETERRLVRAPTPPVPVFTVGLGDTNSPEDVRIEQVDYGSVVRVPSRS
jgi:hypothetical protein